jgi:hypothetical protein
MQKILVCFIGYEVKVNNSVCVCYLSLLLSHGVLAYSVFYWSLRQEKMQIFSILTQKITRIMALGQSYHNKLQISHVWMNASSILLLWHFFYHETVLDFFESLHFIFFFCPPDEGKKVHDASETFIALTLLSEAAERSRLVHSNHLMGSSFAKTVANFFTSDNVFEYRSDL